MLFNIVDNCGDQDLRNQESREPTTCVANRYRKILKLHYMSNLPLPINQLVILLFAFAETEEDKRE